MRALRKSLLLLALAAPLPAAAQTCGNFTDVFPANFFCNDVEWIGNRQVTFGCTATEYCPNNNVLRSQMAAFLRRLGDVLTPQIERTIDVALAQTFDPPFVFCESPSVAVTNYPRQASFAATMMNYNAASSKTIQGELVFSTAGPTGPWQSTGDAVMWQTIGPTVERQTLALVGGPLNLNVGTTYHFAIRVITTAPAVQAAAECQLNVRIESRTGATSPI